jgi:hypothetical protein
VVYDYGYSGGCGRIAASDKYLFADASFHWFIAGGLACKLGYQWRTLGFGQGTTVRINGGYAGVEVEF